MPIMPAEEQVQGESEEEEELEPLRTAPDPQLPTEAEVEDHRIDHANYRSWCEFCRRGRGLGEQRGQGSDQPHALPIIGMDYFFLTKDDVHTRDTLEVPEGENVDEFVEKALERAGT